MFQVWSANVGDNAPRRRPDTVVLQMPGLRGAGRSRAAGGTARGFHAAWRRAGGPVTRSLQDLVFFPAPNLRCTDLALPAGGTKV
jgi:hypothetical protein